MELRLKGKGHWCSVIPVGWVILSLESGELKAMELQWSRSSLLLYEKVSWQLKGLIPNLWCSTHRKPSCLPLFFMFGNCRVRVPGWNDSPCLQQGSMSSSTHLRDNGTSLRSSETPQKLTVRLHGCEASVTGSTLGQQALLWFAAQNAMCCWGTHQSRPGESLWVEF